MVRNSIGIARSHNIVSLAAASTASPALHDLDKLPSFDLDNTIAFRAFRAMGSHYIFAGPMADTLLYTRWAYCIR